MVARPEWSNGFRPGATDFYTEVQMLRVRLCALLGLVGAGLGAGVATAQAASVKTSSTFAGYEVTETKGIKTATITFVVPTITCKQNYSGVGPSVVIASTVHKNTYSYSGGAIAVACQNKQPVYVALPIVDGTNYNDRNVPIAAGDKITVTVKYGQKTAVTLVDDTTHQVDKHTGRKSLGESAYFGDSGLEINHKGVGLDPFTPTPFSAATVNGQPIGKASPQRYDWVDSHHNVLITASALTHKENFTTRFKRST
jgi:hypothetical protein